jgi:hypothetical protein
MNQQKSTNQTEINQMKTKSLLLAGALGLGFATVAGATQYVYVTGSTAARGAFFNSVTNGSTVFDAAPSIVTQGSSNPGGSTYMNFSNTLSGVATIVKCHWSGSEGGISDLSGSATEQFLDDAATTSSSSTGPFISSTVDLCMADNDKAFSRNPGAAITGTKVCIIPFKWEKEKGSAADLTNVSDQNLRAALNGFAKLAQFTGNSADTNFVYVSGRDNQSGTRVNEYGDTGFGIFSAPSQLEVNSDGSMLNQGGGVYLGDYGYSGGGTLATQLGYDLSQSTAVDVANGDGIEHYSVVAMLGTGDAATAEANGASPLAYNGIPYSTAAIIEGQWNAWGNEFIYHKNTVSSQALTVFNALASSTGISGHADGVNTIKLSSMHAVRNGPTSDPIHL